MQTKADYIRVVILKFELEGEDLSELAKQAANALVKHQRQKSMVDFGDRSEGAVAV